MASYVRYVLAEDEAEVIVNTLSSTADVITAAYNEAGDDAR